MKNNQYLLYFNSTEFKKFQSVDINFLPMRALISPAHGGEDRDPITSTGAHPAEYRSGPGIAAFRRETMLPRLIPVGPEDIADRSAAGRLRVLRRLAKALRGERSRGRAGHWTYSLNRHVGLLEAFRLEKAALRALGTAAVSGAHSRSDVPVAATPALAPFIGASDGAPGSHCTE